MTLLQCSHRPQCCRIVERHHYINRRIGIQQAVQRRHGKFQLTVAACAAGDLILRMRGNGVAKPSNTVDRRLGGRVLQQGDARGITRAHQMLSA